MIIKYTGSFDDKLGSQDAIRITGVKVDNGEEWEKKIFANNRDLREALEDIGEGEFVNITMTQKGQYWNVTGIAIASDALVQAAKEKGSFSAGSTPNQKTTGSMGAPSGKSSTWNGRTGEAYDRSASVYLSFDILKSTMTDAALKKLGADGATAAVMNTADQLFDYIHSNINPFEDPLSPPDVG